MAARLYSQKEFDSELMRRGCVRMDSDDMSSYWKQLGNGKAFQVPLPEETVDGEPRYADFILDDLIERHGLASAPSNH